MKSGEFDDPAIAAQWLAEQRERVIRYLDGQEVRHRGVAPEPEWFVAPYVSLWRVESFAKPGALGWWAISGDLPADHLSGRDALDARGALREFARQWHEVAAYMLRGKEHPTMRIGNPENREELGDLLRRRADIFIRWAEDDEIW